MPEKLLNNQHPLELAAFSGATRDALKEKLEKFFQPFASDFESIRKKARLTREAFSPQSPCRLTMMLDPETDISAQKEIIWHHLNNPAESQWTEKAMYFNENDNPGSIGLVFPGQGSQYVQMGADMVQVLAES